MALCLCKLPQDLYKLIIIFIFVMKRIQKYLNIFTCSGKEMIGGKNVALKQEKPANLWEYYICLEIQDRIRIDEMVNNLRL